jgi:hypothetical protein
MAKFTVEQNEQYYRVRLDPYKLRHSKGMEHRSICPLHGGSNPTQFWVDFAEGNFLLLLLWRKGSIRLHSRAGDDCQNNWAITHAR